jgi:hypothetical protein
MSTTQWIVFLLPRIVVGLAFGVVCGLIGMSWCHYRGYAWWRCWWGGHWELVDFDRLNSPFDGERWLRVSRCSREVLPFTLNSLIRCEHDGKVVYEQDQDEYERVHRR